MITRIEALNFRCLRYISQELKPFQVLVGPNASGKTTFLDVPSFIADCLADGLDAAISHRTNSFSDLTWGRNGESFELAIEAKVPESKQNEGAVFETIRYELGIRLEQSSNEVGIFWEKAWLIPKRDAKRPPSQRMLFPEGPNPPSSIFFKKTPPKGVKAVLSKAASGNDNFYLENKRGRDWMPAFKFGPKKLALANLPADETKFPISVWFRDFLVNKVQKLVLNSLLIRQASRPGQGTVFNPDGSNLPWVIAALQNGEKPDPRKQDRLKRWIAQLQTALPDLEWIRSVEREDDKHRYLMLRYKGGLEIPSWMASDGTLRMLALTLPAFLPDFDGSYLIEEPENGIHPNAVETVCQALSSVHRGQVLLATHSPVILSMTDPSDTLCFAKTSQGETDIVRGDQHPSLREWKGNPSFDVLFASGVLGG